MFFITKFVVLICICSSISSTNVDQWFSKSQCTQKEFANHMEITCEENQWILIGWSHYGTKKNRTIDEHRCEPTPTDCVMDYTHKIAELCNGLSRCEVILTQQFIHKCSDEANYLFISYQCVQNSSIVDICSERSVTSSSSIHLISPAFPNEYPNNVNCSCEIQSNSQSLSNVIIDVENFSFHLQDNDRLVSLSGTFPFGSSLFIGRNQLNLRFQTDETLSQSGFWIRFEGHHQCHDDEQSLGSKCLKIFVEKQNYQTAVEQCLALNSNLIDLNDIIEEKKLTNFFSFYKFDEKISIWISNDPDGLTKRNENQSWWPWRSSTDEGACVLRTSDGWFHRSCDEEHSFICQRNLNPISIPLTLRCGQTTFTTSTTSTTTTTTITTTTTTTTSSSISSLPIRPFLLKEKTTVEPRTTSIDPNILAAILGGVAILIFSLNLIVCYLCRREKVLKPKVSNESQSSLTHEDFQHSLMQHLYNEQMNTISSTSSKQSQSKSNETTTSHVQLSSTIEQRGDYHFYETIPPDFPSAFKAVRTSYDTLTHHRVCCFHPSNCQPATTTTDPAFLVGSESIV